MYLTGGSNEAIQLFITTDGKLKVAGRDALDFEVLGGVPGQLEDFGAEVFKDGSRVDGSGGTNALVGLHAGLQVAVDTTDRELNCRVNGSCI